MRERHQHMRTWGFRFSPTDAVALILFGAAVSILHRFGSSLSWIVAIVAGHFFLFCNVDLGRHICGERRILAFAGQVGLAQRPGLSIAHKRRCHRLGAESLAIPRHFR